MGYEQHLRARIAAIFALILIFTISAISSAVGSAREFKAFYFVKNITNLGSEVRLTLDVRLFNLTDRELANATLSVMDSLLPAKLYGSFPSAEIRAHENIRLSGEFTLPRREYERWQKGVHPNLVLVFQDGDRSRTQQRVEAIRHPMGGKE